MAAGGPVAWGAVGPGGNPYLPPSHKKTSAVGVVLLSVIAVALLAGVVVGGVALARKQSKEEEASASTVSTTPAPPTTEGTPSWAVDPDVGGDTPSMQAVTLVCAGQPFPGRLATKAKSGTRSIGYWWKSDIESADTDFVRGGGIVPGPKPVADTSVHAHTVYDITRWAPMGWVACVSLLDTGPSEAAQYCTGPDIGLVPHSCPDPVTVAWHGHTTWKVEIRETATGKLLNQGQVEASETRPDTIHFSATSGPPAQMGAEIGQDQIDRIVHDTLG